MSKLAAVILSVVVAMPMSVLMTARAQELPEPSKPELIIGGQPTGPTAPPRNFERCVDVEIGGARSFGCINQSLKRDVDKVAPSLNMPPLDARSGDTKIGVVNVPGVQQQYGQNFGRSVVPFRPPQITFGTTPRR